ncbi:phosphoesterase [Ligilactobacillus sp. WILCCON 0076]|uniref:Phosphoesterase n=1 Tax=Ligilactobacillus ubinensis TaxID=2876789 RepID=A0A9X2JLK5_9LACO|nr:phosphoesterase [Ligilactobacillus ubinensis]MCP0886695.1 phosphoesterase [Ligilactobacillus ubinensis]
MTKKTRYIKLFSHNDLDGFGAPALFDAVQDQLFKGIIFDLTTCPAGRLDSKLATWFRQPDITRYTDVFIMDMTPDSDYSFQQLEQHFANHWLIFDHHESEEKLRQDYASNCISPNNTTINPSATSLVWDWLQKNPNFSRLNPQKKSDLAELVELIRAYDTWDWQNDPDFPLEKRQAADDLNQLFWFYPLNKSHQFVNDVFTIGWSNYRKQNMLLIETLNGRRQSYMQKHLRTVTTFKIKDNSFGVVYASDYKSEIAHALLKKFPVDAALVIDDHSISLRSNGKLDVATFATEYFSGGGHADSAGGKLIINPIEIGEQAVVDIIKQHEQVTERVNAEAQVESSSVGDQLDPKVAAKLAALFNKD